METWYVMEDGSLGDPGDVALGKDGLLRHKDGRAVAYAPHGPRTRSVDPDEARKAQPKSAPKLKPATKPKPGGGDDDAKDMKPEASKRGYKTR